MKQYDKSQYYVDFSDRENLTTAEKNALQVIQDTYRPVERVTLLLDYKIQGKITGDDFQTMTGLPYTF